MCIYCIIDECDTTSLVTNALNVVYLSFQSLLLFLFCLCLLFFFFFFVVAFVDSISRSHQGFNTMNMQSPDTIETLTLRFKSSFDFDSKILISHRSYKPVRIQCYIASYLIRMQWDKLLHVVHETDILWTSEPFVSQAVSWFSLTSQSAMPVLMCNWTHNRGYLHAQGNMPHLIQMNMKCIQSQNRLKCCRVFDHTLFCKMQPILFLTKTHSAVLKKCYLYFCQVYANSIL